MNFKKDSIGLNSVNYIPPHLVRDVVVLTEEDSLENEYKTTIRKPIIVSVYCWCNLYHDEALAESSAKVKISYW